MVDAVPTSQGAGRCLAGRFVLEERIGLGGMGEVYRARHLELNTLVAVKLLSRRLQGQEAAIRRFRREARSAARLRSAHIVQVFDFGIDGGVPFLVMELLQGESLAGRASREHRFDLSTVASWLEQAAHGLAVAHANGVVHRDVKPSNLFLATDGSREILKILDFGVAKPEDEEDEDGALTGARMLVGSPLYMSPEQASGARVDARTDVWALGAVAFRLLTGQDAFAAPTTREVLATIRSGSPPTATSVVPALPVELDAFFQCALAWNPEERFRTVEELASAFSRLTQGPKTPILAEHSGARSSTTQPFLSVDPAPEPVKPAARRTTIVSRVALAFAGLATCVGLGLWARRDRDELPRAAPAVPLVSPAPKREAATKREAAAARNLTSVTSASLSTVNPRLRDVPEAEQSARPRSPLPVMPDEPTSASTQRKAHSRPVPPADASTRAPGTPRAPQPDPLFGL